MQRRKWMHFNIMKTKTSVRVALFTSIHVTTKTKFWRLVIIWLITQVNKLINMKLQYTQVNSVSGAGPRSSFTQGVITHRVSGPDWGYFAPFWTIFLAFVTSWTTSRTFFRIYQTLKLTLQVKNIYFKKARLKFRDMSWQSFNELTKLTINQSWHNWQLCFLPVDPGAATRASCTFRSEEPRRCSAPPPPTRLASPSPRWRSSPYV